jgi:hypothetical protein
MEIKCKSEVKKMSKEFRKFSFRVDVVVTPDHPLYEEPARVIKGELGLLIMNGMSADPMIGYTCEVI